MSDLVMASTPIYFTKTFAKKPDLTLDLLQKGTGDKLTMLATALLKQDFDIRGIEDDSWKDRLSGNQRRALSSQQELHVEMHVSRKHLTEASPVFEVLLDGDFSEANAKRVQISEDHIAIFTILVSIMHGQTQSIKDIYLNVDQLFQLCVMIDRRVLYETNSACTDIWFDRVKGQLPIGPSEDVERWLFITYFLEKEFEFFKLTTTVQRKFVELECSVESPLLHSIPGKHQNPTANGN